MDYSRHPALEISAEHLAARDIATSAANGDRFPGGVFEIVPGAIYEFVRPMGLVYRVSIARVLPDRGRFVYVVDTLTFDQRWRRSKYGGHGRSEADALERAIQDISVDQAPHGDE